MRAPPLALAGYGIGALLVLAARDAGAQPLALRLDYGMPGAPAPTLVAAWREPPPVELPLVLRPDPRLGGEPGLPGGSLPADERPEEAPRERPPYAPPEPGPRERAEGEAGLADVRWRLAPIRWRGLLSTDLRSFSADGQPRQFQQVETAHVQGASYIYQPWFAQLNFGVNGLMAKDRGASTGRSTALGGNALLNVFPTSRYPFQAHFDRSDNRSSDQFTGQQYTTQRMGVRQSYRSLAGDQNSSATFERSTLSSPLLGEDTVVLLGAAHSRRIDERQSVDGDANRTVNFRSASGEKSRFDRAYARHRFQSDGLLNVETLGSYGGSLQSGGPGGAPAFRNDTVQLNSFGTWRRAEDDPLHLTGGLRFFQSTFSGGAQASESRSLMANAAASYRASQNLMLNGGASLAQASGSEGAHLLTSQFAGATYTPDLRRFGQFAYTSSLTGTVNNQTGGNETGRRLISGQGMHAVQRSFDFSPAQSLSLNVSQSLAVSQDSVAGGLRTLAHYGGLSYRLQASNALAGFASASASDSRTTGYSSAAFQLLNLQLSGQGSFGRYSSISANYTVQGTRQSAAGRDGGGFNVSANGGATYQHARAFGVPRLRYLAVYQRNDFQLNTRQQGDLDAPLEHINSSFEQRLEYRIGKVELRLSHRLAQIDGKKNALLFLRLVREFGD